MQATDIKRPSPIRQLRSASYAATKICKIRSRLRTRGILNAALPGHNSARLHNAYPNFALSDARVSIDARFRCTDDVVLVNGCSFYAATKGERRSIDAEDPSNFPFTANLF